MSGLRKALIIANDEYEQPALRNLIAPAADADALRGVLGNPQIGDFTVQVMRNQQAHVIQAQIEEIFSESRPDDMLLLHFSGHGLKSESGELFFAASNTKLNRLRATAIPAEFVQRCMQDSMSRSIVLLLDCCYGGAFSQFVNVRATGDADVLSSFPQGRTGGGRGRAVITASSAMEYAFEGDRLGNAQQRQPSVFTAALVEGLATGDADQDEDGWISLDELYNYIFDKVRARNSHQTPSRRFDLEGELYIARSQRRRIRPGAIPPDLQAAFADKNRITRLGVVAELRRRLASSDPAVAAGAHRALTEIAQTASQYLAEIAREALSTAARPAPRAPAPPPANTPAKPETAAQPAVTRQPATAPANRYRAGPSAEETKWDKVGDVRPQRGAGEPQRAYGDSDAPTAWIWVAAVVVTIVVTIVGLVSLH